jgi:hypothetical protein
VAVLETNQKLQCRWLLLFGVGPLIGLQKLPNWLYETVDLMGFPNPKRELGITFVAFSRIIPR